MVDPITFFLSFVADKFFGRLIEMAAEGQTGTVLRKIRGDPARNAFKQALGAAIKRYATTGGRVDSVAPLMEKNGILADPQVTEELTHIVRFDREPNAELIGQRWKQSLDQPPAWRDYTYEANLLIGYLRTELRATEAFRPVFEEKSLNAISDVVGTATQDLSNIEIQLENLNQLLTGAFGDLARTFGGASYEVHEHIRDYSRYIAEKTRAFVGRKFVFDAITQFMNNNPRGYFFVRGDPGIGKTALLAELVKTKGYVHHFYIRAEGISNSDAFLSNVCAQLVAAYKLDHRFLPRESTQDAGFLNKLLGEVSDGLQSDQKAVVVVDAVNDN